MDQASNELRLQRAARLLSRRAADELLIEAIFGDVLFGRLPRDDAGDALQSGDPVLAAAVHPALAKAL